MFKLFKNLKPYALRIVLIFITVLLKIGCDLLLPMFLRTVIDDGVSKMDMAAVYQNGLYMIIFAILSVILFILMNWQVNYVGASFAADVRRKIYEKVESLSFEQFNTIGNASLQVRSTQDVGWLQELVNGGVFILLYVPMSMIGGSIFIFSIDPVLSLFIIAAIPIIIIVIYFITKYVRPLMKKANEYSDKMMLTLRERLVGIRVIRAFNKEDHEHKRFEGTARKASINFIKNNVAMGTVQPIMTFIVNIIIVLLIYFGTIRSVNNSGSISTGGLMSVINYTSITMSAIGMCAHLAIMMPRIQLSCGRINEILMMEKSDQTGMGLKNARSLPKIEGDIELKNVTFYYDKSSDAPCLSNINIRIPQGKTVSILGGTGSGKSTVAKLLLRFYDVSNCTQDEHSGEDNNTGCGEILFDGKNIKDYDVDHLRDNIAYISQRSVLFDGTIESNIRLGKEDATDEEIARAVRIAQLGDFVKSCENGLQYSIKEAGSNLSGGQKQRISIARAIVKQSPLFIFDDSFSALDFLTDKQLRRALKAETVNTSCLIITQRVSTALNSDLIYVLDKGCIVGSGTHKQLLKTCEVYRELTRLQMGIELPALEEK